ncbi:MAG: hypothetical protein RR365_14370 [Bacteroides sp.]
MVGFKHTICALLLTVFSGVAIAQNNTNSPYTRYGYGDLVDQNFGNSKAMGGIAYGLRDGSQINPLNPASYTAVDSLTFLFEGGFTLQNVNMSLGTTKLNAKNSSLDYLSMQFRMRKWLAMSIGLLPFSNVGYSLNQGSPATDASPDNVKMYSGDGGLHQLYVGIGAKVWKNLSVGANVSYFWGEISRTTTMLFPSNSGADSYQQLTHMAVTDYKLDFGAQYTQAFGKKHALTFGAVFTPKKTLNNDTYIQTTMSNATGGARSISTKDTAVVAGIPSSLGFGLTYNYDKRLTVGLDYSIQKWGDVMYMNQSHTFCDRSKISFGAEYLPSMVKRSYFSHVKYRLGAYYTTPYYKLEGTDQRATREYGVTAGFGLPMPMTRSIVSITAQYVRVKGLVPTAIDENRLRLSIGITFNDRWFYKRKVN